ncbi:hypothetical protein QUF74_13610 [Candidatus Halobeggiatoa sp. HSG11]|nr:hypothetical protein [Candidatus Halobeggiatoa sp. HSG11]
MSDLNILRELIRKEALVEIEEGYYGRKKVKLHERERADNDSYTVEIQQIPPDSVVIKTDKFPPPREIFNDIKGVCKRADFVIITHTTIKQKPKNLIIFIELKRGKTDLEASIIQQLKGAQCVIAYCRSIGQEFWQQQNFLNPDEYESRFVSIRNISVNKKTTIKPNPDGVHNRPEYMLKINSPNYLEFKRLIAG